MKISSIWDNKYLKRILIISFWILIWQIVSLIISEEILLVSPLNVFKELSQMVLTRQYWLTIFNSTYKIIIGLILSIVVGVLFGYLSYVISFFRDFIHPLIGFFRAIPVASFVIFLLIWINSRNLSIYISFIMGMPIIYENVYTGFISIDKKLKEMAKVFNISTFKIIKYIYIIKVKDYFKSGVISSSGLIFKAAIAAEVIGLQPNSIGEKLYFSKVYLNMRELFSWTITILILSLIFEKLIKVFLGGKHDKI